MKTYFPKDNVPNHLSSSSFDITQMVLYSREMKCYAIAGEITGSRIIYLIHLIDSLFARNPVV